MLIALPSVEKFNNCGYYWQMKIIFIIIVKLVLKLLVLFLYYSMFSYMNFSDSSPEAAISQR